MHRLATSFSRHYVQRSVQFGKYLNSNYSRFYSSKANPLSETYISASNCHYIEEFYTQWKQDPTSVEASWAELFRSVDEMKPHGEALPPLTRLSKFAGTTGSPYDWSAVDTLKIFNIIRSYRVLGHFMADLDPLGLEKASFSKIKEDYKKELLPASYGFTEADMDREFFIGEELVLAPGKKSATLREIINHLQKVYCGTIGVQFMHVQDPAVKDWVRDKFESNEIFKASKEDKKKIFKELLEAEEFENFCQHQFKVKRFGLNGGESLIPGMHALLESISDYGIENVVIGMSHRGRLNVMANIMGKPLIQIFNEFQIDTIHGTELAASVLGTGDVKYHLGTSHDRIIKDKKVHLSMAANPSHLEAVNPVVVGKTRAKQTDKEGKIDHNKAIGILIHGDAAFAGQGIVGETIELSGLDDFTTGGTIHIIVNNQIGFTTVPKYARTSPYPSEIAKAAGSPIFHVNGDHPESVAAVFKLAAEFRQKFNRDTVIDIYCYRRHGHNEFDEPRFTQPKMYQKIAEHPTVATIYQSKLVKEHSITEEEAKNAKENVIAVLRDGYQKRDQYKSITSDWLECHWKGFTPFSLGGKVFPTGVDSDVLRRILKCLITLPEGFKLHPSLEKYRFNQIQKILESEKNIPWAIGEALALGSLLLENYEVRLCGQDCERGTFSQRHAVYYCQETEKKYEPLEHLATNQGHFNVINSSLSESAVLGFELGYSLENPNALVIWEAQFGDFANGAQVIIDQFISSGEQKWLRMSGLTMLLPHGFEGQGPEHSSARLERFLQLCDDNPYQTPETVDKQMQQINLQVANCTTPANLFHLLRRQLHRNYRKPLVVMTPKSLLTKEDCVSTLEDFGTSSQFYRLYSDSTQGLLPDSQITTLILCTGKVYYDLVSKRTELNRKDVAIARVELIAPFPFDLVKEQLEKYSNAKVVWVQEEPRNQGSWNYVAPRIETSGRRPTYVGRAASAAPATGLLQRHTAELAKFLREAFE